jgi:REP element-mobilizing transposase RayT
MYVFAVKRRECLINEDIETKLYPFIGNLINNTNHKLFQINGSKEHVHILVSLHPTESISDFIKAIKSKSSKYINEQKLTAKKFYWQRGYGAFSYSHSQLNQIINYIKNQKEHHNIKTFREEYIALLEKFGIDYKSEFLFNFFDV